MATLSNHYAYLPFQVTDASYTTLLPSINTADLNGDGNQDLLILGTAYPGSGGLLSPVTQPSKVLFGDGNGGFTSASESVFPTSTLTTVHPRKVIFDDLNNDGKLDIFISNHGWDTNPFPGEQNRLYLSSNSGWVDATLSLPQLNDFSHTAAIADINNDGFKDIFVGNGYAGQNGILSYMLMNNGNGTFTKNSSNIPVHSGAIFDFNSQHQFNDASFSDLDDDGYVDLIISVDHNSQWSANNQSVILWNNHGSFSQDNMTSLPLQSVFPYHVDLEAQSIDVDNDGLKDIVMVGANGQPFYDGRFLQLFINNGNRNFTDETSQRLSMSDISSGQNGVSTNTTAAFWVKVIDFNRDGFSDFAVKYNGSTFTADMPLIYLNDGTGHFTTLKVGDFVSSGNEWQIYGGHLVETKNGYSLLNVQTNSNGLYITGLIANSYVSSDLTDLIYHSNGNIDGTSGSDNDIVPFILTDSIVDMGTGIDTLTLSNGENRATIKGVENIFCGAGNDILTKGDNTSSSIDGQGGLDTLVISSNKLAYSITQTTTGYTLKSSLFTDNLTSIERVKFTDTNVAFDLDGHAGKVAKILGAVFGFSAVGNKEYAGIGINLLDNGMSYETLSELAINVKGLNSDRAIVDLLYTNVVGSTPSSSDAQYFVDLLNNGMTKGQLVALAADTTQNQTMINLVGLSNTGLEYTFV